MGVVLGSYHALNKVVRQYIDDKIAEIGGAIRIKGSVQTYADLPTEDNNPGDWWYVIEDAVGYVYTTSGEWKSTAGFIDLSAYLRIDDDATAEEMAEILAVLS